MDWENVTELDSQGGRDSQDPLIVAGTRGARHE
jgi:hypothetical protein